MEAGRVNVSQRERRKTFFFFDRGENALAGNVYSLSGCLPLADWLNLPRPSNFLCPL